MRVFINPGHALNGNPDPGACNEELHLRESDLASHYGSLCAHYLEDEGFEVKLLQSHNLNGECPEYPSVVGAANSWPADIFVSIHVNAGGGRGPETLCYWRQSEAGQLATLVQRELVTSLSPYDHGYYDRGVKERQDLCVLRRTDMPAILVETGFIDTEDTRILTVYGDDIARAIARGVADYQQSL